MPNDPTSFEQLLASELGNSTALDKILELLAAFGPLNAPIVGTKGADVLSPAAEGDSIFGLAGKDQLSSSLNRTLLFGGLGDDALSTNVVMPPSDAASRGLAFQSGGDGNDKLDASVTYGQGTASGLSHDDRAVLIVQDGGAGGDTITTRAGGSSQFTTGSMDVQTFVFGGSGNDTITVTADAKGVLWATASSPMSSMAAPATTGSPHMPKPSTLGCDRQRQQRGDGRATATTSST